MSLGAVQRFRVGADVVARTEEALCTAGREGYELFVLWSGRVSGPEFFVDTPHVPKQTSYRLDSGLSVRVNGDELHRLNVWLFDASQILGVQIHAHPTGAFHSDTDDAYPIVATIGGLSIVAPDFCRRGLFTSGTALFRLAENGWIEQPASIVTVA
jgi:hypothetical protein